jgi:hypothetical protein
MARDSGKFYWKWGRVALENIFDNGGLVLYDKR